MAELRDILKAKNGDEFHAEFLDDGVTLKVNVDWSEEGRKDIYYFIGNRSFQLYKFGERYFYRVWQEK